MTSPRGNAPSAASAELEQLRLDHAALVERLREAQETLDAIRSGDVDAVVVSGADSIPRVYALETADRTYRLLVEEMQEGALTLSTAGDILYCNERLARLVESASSRVIGTSLRRFVAADDWQAVVGMIHNQSKGECTLRSEAGSSVAVYLSFSALGDEVDGERLYCCIVTDLTEQRRTGDALRTAHEALLLQVAERERTERLLRHSQKMEAVGQLTGGIAHDFNNLLMVISGGLSVLERDPPADRRQRLLAGMRQAAERGAGLTRQLLAFSRQKELHATDIDLRVHIEGMRELLDRSLRGDVTVETRLDADIWPVCVDAGELEIALLNLCVNARDAMPGGGQITIAGSNKPRLRDFGLDGDFVDLCVIDTGQGMEASVAARCLEPFYTTKDVGKGSGLGLAQVYGFVHGSRGALQIDSQPGSGTSVRLLLPRSLQAPAVNSHRPSVAAQLQAPGTCNVLLVEDDSAVAALTQDMLQELGYRVTHVPSAQEGLDVLREGHGMDLVLSDVMMPGGMNGLSLAREIRRRDKTFPVVLVSGYADAVRQDADRECIPILAKPYGLDHLSQVLQAAINSRH